MRERKSEVLSVPVAKQVLAAVDRVANASWTSRSEFVRRAVLKDLEQRALRRTHDEQLLAAMMTLCLTRRALAKTGQ